MASNHTANYNLSQWEENDEVLRADFNADNAKLDAALLALEGAYTPNSKPFVIGSYIGNGAAYQDITLGFQPSAVLIVKGGGDFEDCYDSNRWHYAALALWGNNADRYSRPGQTGWENKVTMAAITATGFRVAYFTDERYHCYLNAGGTNIYFYIAFR